MATTEQALVISLITSLILNIPSLSYAKNCIKGKPCGKGCIALDKTCRINASPSGDDKTLRYESGLKPGAIIRRTVHRLPRVHRVKTASVMASESPDTNTGKHTGQRYKRGQRVFVYETYNNWARINNMHPEEWIERKFLEELHR
jgi:hypothetical protein